MLLKITKPTVNVCLHVHQDFSMILISAHLVKQIVHYVLIKHYVHNAVQDLFSEKIIHVLLTVQWVNILKITVIV